VIPEFVPVEVLREKRSRRKRRIKRDLRIRDLRKKS
jgi:hypothetical protein